MSNTVNIQELKRINWVLENLKRISRSIHHLDECACNYELSKRQESRRNNLLRAANEWAGHLGLKVYHQADPRGCALYIVPLDFKNDDDYTGKGMAIA